MNFQQKTVFRQNLFDSCSIYLLKELCLIVLEYAKEFEGVLVDRWDLRHQSYIVKFDPSFGVLRCESCIIDFKTKTVTAATKAPSDLVLAKGLRCVNGNQYWFVTDNELVHGCFTDVREKRLLIKKDTIILKLQYYNNELRCLCVDKRCLVLINPFRKDRVQSKRFVNLLMDVHYVNSSSVSFSPNGKYLAVVCKENKVLSVYDLENNMVKTSRVATWEFDYVECGKNNIFIVCESELLVYNYNVEKVKTIDTDLSTSTIYPVDDGLVIRSLDQGTMLYYL